MDPHDLADVTRQGGAFTGRQWRQRNRWEELRDWQAAGLVVREKRTVYRLADAAPTIAARFARAELLTGRTLIASHQSAAELHGFGVLPSSLLHVTTLDARSVKAPLGVAVHQMVLRAPPICVGGVRCVDAADSAIDVTASAAPIDVLAVLDAALRAGVPRDALIDAAARALRMRGILEVRRQLPGATPLAESPMESRARYRVLQAGIPEPELQIAVSIPGGGFRRLDMGWRQARVGLEFDGQDFHSGDGSLDRDRRRSGELIAAGWTVLSITGRDVYQHPERFTDAVRSLLRDHQR